MHACACVQSLTAARSARLLCTASKVLEMLRSCISILRQQGWQSRRIVEASLPCLSECDCCNIHKSASCCVARLVLLSNNEGSPDGLILWNQRKHT